MTYIRPNLTRTRELMRLASTSMIREKVKVEFESRNVDLFIQPVHLSEQELKVEEEKEALLLRRHWEEHVDT